MNRRELFGRAGSAVAAIFAARLVGSRGDVVQAFTPNEVAPESGALNPAVVQSLYDNLPFRYTMEWPIGLALWNDKAVARFTTFEFDER